MWATQGGMCGLPERANECSVGRDARQVSTCCFWLCVACVVELACSLHTSSCPNDALELSVEQV
jgi:hypothetical protein